MMESIKELQAAGIEPDVWKIEGLDHREDCVQIAETARRGGRENVGCIILGRGSNDQKVVQMAAQCGRSGRLYRIRRGPDLILATTGLVARW